MMDLIVAVPLPVRLALLFAIGLVAGRLVNRGIYQLAWTKRRLGPWNAPPDDAPARSPGVHIPVVGWWWLRRESPWHGRAYWIRPMLIELAAGLSLAWLYWYEVDQAALFIWPGFRPDNVTTHAQFLSHAVLLALMTVATFIDFDEQTIPDAITVLGALAGLVIAAALPQSRLLVSVWSSWQWGTWTIAPLHLASPSPWPEWLGRAPGLALGLVCWGAWWCAVVPWTWTTRRGWNKAIQFWLASFLRRMSAGLLAVLAAGTLVICAAWWSGDVRWQSTLSALVGMVFGGGLIWAVRVIGSSALQQEAMGFGDVTLMAMIGAFTGWQATLMIFFLAPFAAVIISVTQWLLTRRKDIAFGPYLCLATAFLVMNWGPVWKEYGQRIFALGRLVPALVALCLAMLGGMLYGLRLYRQWRYRFEDEDESAPYDPACEPAAENGLSRDDGT